MAMFVLPFVLLVLLVAILWGCWWLIPAAAIALAIGFTGYYSWLWSGRIAGARGSFPVWWAANRPRLMWAMSIFTSILLVGIIIYCVVHRFAPSCTGGCLSQPRAAITAPRSSTMGTVADGSVYPERISITHEWSAPQFKPGYHLDFMPEEKVGYEIRPVDGEPVARPKEATDHVTLPDTPRGFELRILDGESATALRMRVSYTPLPHLTDSPAVEDKKLPPPEVVHM